MLSFDMLVKLYELPEVHITNPTLASQGIRIIRPMASDKSQISSFIRNNFSEVWANEFEKSMCNTPISCYIAVKDKKEIVGFSCYDASCLNFFGPIGVAEVYQGKGLGKELLLHALYAMREEGYAYAIIGWCEEKNAAFYSKATNAIVIEDSFPGVYQNALDIEN